MVTPIAALSPQCLATRHNDEMPTCRTCSCGCHGRKIPIPPEVVHAARVAAARARTARAAQAARLARHASDLPGRIRLALNSRETSR